MSQKVTRKAAVNEDKEKRSADSPVKEMKKKMAANAEKEKQAAEKADKAEKTSEKAAEKATEKADKSEKTDKSADKKADKKDHSEKKDGDKKSDKPEPQPEKSKEEHSKDDKCGKSEKEKADSKRAETSKPKQNGRERVHNGVSDVTLGNGTDDVLNGTVSADSEDDDVMLVIDDHDHDELFPELTYDDTSDVECFEPPTPENVPSRSFTRRSQVKAARTPETPRPATLTPLTPLTAADKLADNTADDPKDSKVLKLKDDAQVPPTDRKLRSADSPKPQEKKQDTDNKQDADKKKDSDKKQDADNKQETGKKDTPKKQDKGGQEKEESKDVVGDKKTEESKSHDDKLEMDVVVEIETNVDGDELPRKTDTNFSKSRVKVSPYRRSMRLADQTNTSVVANYTGNNTTMEMDITESSSIMEDNLDDSSYLRGLRSIRGRSSYKPLKEITLRHTANRSVRSNTSVNTLSSPLSEHSRPTGTVVGRKRKPEQEDSIEIASEADPDVYVPRTGVSGSMGSAGLSGPAGKRMRVLDRITEPFRRVASVAVPSASAHRRNAEIVGINTDLPLTAPVAAPDTFDPESLKPTPRPDAPIAVPLPTREHADNKRCSIM